MNLLPPSTSPMPDNPNDLPLSSPIDLRSIDPDADPAAEARFVDGVMERVRVRSPHPAPTDVLWGVWSFGRPLVAAAAIVLAVAGTMTVRALRPPAGVPLTVAEAVGIPAELQTAGREPAP